MPRIKRGNGEKIALMWCYTIFDNQKHELKKLLIKGFQEQGFSCAFFEGRPDVLKNPNQPHAVALMEAAGDERRRFIQSDAVIALEAAADRYTGRPFVCKKAIIPGTSSGGLSRFAGAQSVISYGMAQTDSLSASALNRSTVLSIRREIITLSGQVVDIQEIPLLPKASGEIGLLMAAAATFLISDVPTDKLSSLLSGTE